MRPRRAHPDAMQSYGCAVGVAWPAMLGRERGGHEARRRATRRDIQCGKTFRGSTADFCEQIPKMARCRVAVGTRSGRIWRHANPISGGAIVVVVGLALLPHLPIAERSQDKRPPRTLPRRALACQILDVGLGGDQLGFLGAHLLLLGC